MVSLHWKFNPNLYDVFHFEYLQSKQTMKALLWTSSKNKQAQIDAHIHNSQFDPHLHKCFYRLIFCDFFKRHYSKSYGIIIVMTVVRLQLKLYFLFDWNFPIVSSFTWSPKYELRSSLKCRELFYVQLRFTMAYALSRCLGRLCQSFDLTE